MEVWNANLVMDMLVNSLACWWCWWRQWWWWWW